MLLVLYLLIAAGLIRKEYLESHCPTILTV